MLLAKDKYDDARAEKLHLVISWGEYIPYKYGVPDANATNEDAAKEMIFFLCKLAICRCMQG